MITNYLNNHLLFSLSKRGVYKHKIMKTVKRPWGVFKQFTLNEKSTVKVLTILPHQELSLQKHKKRKEMWYFLTPGYVQIGDTKKRVKKGNIINIQKRVKHRAYAKFRKVEFLEISMGNFNEKDEVRLKDKYGRVGKK